MKTIIFPKRADFIYKILNGKSDKMYSGIRLDTPFKAIIYVAKVVAYKRTLLKNKKTGEYRWDTMYDERFEEPLNEKIVCEFIVDDISRCDIIDGYLWHVTNLNIFKKPRTLKDYGFKKILARGNYLKED